MEPSAIAIIVRVVALALLLPRRRELAAALGLETQRQLATGAHRFEDGDRIVDAPDRDQRTRAGVKDARHVGA